MRWCFAELPSVVTYKAGELQGENSGWLLAAYIEFITQTLVFVLFKTYDNLRV